MGLTHYLKKIPLASRTNRMLRTLRRKVSQQPLLRMLRKVHPWENLPAASLQEPYQLLHYQPGDEERWMEVLTASGEFGGWTRSRLAEELLSSLLPGGGIFLAHNGQLVGCAAACRVEQYAPYALLMYVALLPQHRGKGLGNLLVCETLRVTQREGYPGLVLHTENHRLPAVRTYFQLGFLPLLGEGAAGKRQWGTVLNRALFPAAQ